MLTCGATVQHMQHPQISRTIVELKEHRGLQWGGGHTALGGGNGARMGKRLQGFMEGARGGWRSPDVNHDAGERHRKPREQPMHRRRGAHRYGSQSSSVSSTSSSSPGMDGVGPVALHVGTAPAGGLRVVRLWSLYRVR